MNVLAVILARAGSLGLKDKHTRLLLGRPVIQYTIDHAIASTRITRTVVTSDSKDVLRIAQENCLTTIHRPAELATSDASVQSVMLHAMQTVESRSDFRADAAIVLYGNVPVRGEGVIDRAIEMLEKTGCDSVRSFIPVGKWHPAWMSQVDSEGNITPLHPNQIHRRQDLTPVYLHDGAVVAVSRESLERGLTDPDNPHAFFGEHRRAILTAADETVEIDAQRDLYWAEAVLREKGVEPMSWRAAS